MISFVSKRCTCIGLFSVLGLLAACTSVSEQAHTTPRPPTIQGQGTPTAGTEQRSAPPVRPGLRHPQAGLPEERIQKTDTLSVEQVLAAWEENNWTGSADGVLQEALEAYRQGDLERSRSTGDLARWLLLLGQSDSEICRAWKSQMDKSGLMRPELLSLASGRHNVSLALSLDPVLRKQIPLHPECLSAFLSSFSKFDYPPGVLQVLSEVYRSKESAFWPYFNLALAIAVVHDVQPPNTWPHLQMPAAARGVWQSTPTALFAYFVELDQSGHSLQALSRLSVTELVRLVDVPVPLNELRWARLKVHEPLDNFAKVYDQIVYRPRLAVNKSMAWAGDDYSLQAINARGGICVDQAYYAAVAGKASGLPTLIFKGRGTQGRHAWFGFLRADGTWCDDAGRGREQKFTDPLVTDPQTWGEVSEPMLVFDSLSKLGTPRSREAQAHLCAASCFLMAGLAEEGRQAARRALALNPTSVAGWELVLASFGPLRRGDPRPAAAALEEIYGEAAASFGKYPDIEYNFLRRKANSLKGRGQEAQADKCLSLFYERMRGKKSSLNVQGDASAFSKQMPLLSAQDQVLRWKQLLNGQGRRSPITSYDYMVVPFISYLLGQGRLAEGRECLGFARSVLKPVPRSQLDVEFKQLASRIP